MREFPWEGIARIVATPLSFQLKIALHFRSSNNGRTVEVGRRAQIGRRAVVENLAGFDLEQRPGRRLTAIMQIWEGQREPDEDDIAEPISAAPTAFALFQIESGQILDGAPRCQFGGIRSGTSETPSSPKCCRFGKAICEPYEDDILS